MQITSLDQLKAWNKNPTKKAPVVLEWFMDWFFEELLDKEKTSEAVEARIVMIEFTRICEKMSWREAADRVDGNFDYWADRASLAWASKWRALQTMRDRKYEKVVRNIHGGEE